MNRLAVFVYALVTALVAALTLGLGTGLAETPEARTTVLKAEGATTTRATGGQLVLKAVLTTAEGKPISGREVSFYQEVELFGARDSFVGSAITDSTGTAAIAYEAAQRGNLVIKAHFAGDEGLAKSEARAQIEVSQVKVLFEPEPLPYASVGGWLPHILGAIVLTVLAVLAGLLISTVFGIRSAVQATGHSLRPAASTVLARANKRMGGAE